MASTPASVIGPADVTVDAGRGLAIVDVDEVLALFIQGFDRFLQPHGHEFRLQNFGLFNNVFPLGEAEAADKDMAKALFDRFFAEGCGDMDPAPGAVEGLRALSERATVVILTNAPETARELRSGWLIRHGMDYPMLLNEGPKGQAVKTLAERVTGPVLFIDDLLPNLDSAAEHAPWVRTVQMVADPALRRFAPTSPRHTRIDEWAALVELAHREVFA